MLRYSDHAIRRMNERGLSSHLAEIAVALGKKRYTRERALVEYSWNGFVFVVNIETLLVVTAFERKEAANA